jgi:uncharacterized protein (DUF2344 family)
MKRKLKGAKNILKAMGLPEAQQNEISCYTLLALCGLRPKDSWSKATHHSLTISKGIMAYLKKIYKKAYAPNTRETFRRQVLHQFLQAQIIEYNPDNPNLPTNSPRAHYALSELALRTIKKYGTRDWQKAVKEFISKKGSLLELYQKKEKSHEGSSQISRWKNLISITGTA